MNKWTFSFYLIAVQKACKELSRSKKLRSLLQIVLVLGNYMNRGQRGNAAGMSSMNALETFRRAVLIDLKSGLINNVLTDNQFVQIYAFNNECLYVCMC